MIHHQGCPGENNDYCCPEANNDYPEANNDYPGENNDYNQPNDIEPILTSSLEHSVNVNINPLLELVNVNMEDIPEGPIDQEIQLTSSTKNGPRISTSSNG